MPLNGMSANYGHRPKALLVLVLAAYEQSFFRVMASMQCNNFMANIEQFP